MLHPWESVFSVKHLFRHERTACSAREKQKHGVFPLDKRTRFHYNENENREATRGESETEKETLCS